MNNNEGSSSLSGIRRLLWPIEWQENKKFLPMAAMMFCILYNYSTLRSIKDGLVVTGIGTEALSFIKTYMVLPSAVIAIIAYAKLCNIMSQQKVFYTITSFFIAYFALFTFFLYPNPELVHPDPQYIANLSLEHPNLKWFIKIWGKWSFATFYTMSELWGSMMMSLLFWQFANQITKTQEAKRFYSMFGLIGNFGLLLGAIVMKFFLKNELSFIPKGMEFIPVMCMIMLSGLAIMYLYYWIDSNVLTDIRFYDASAVKAKKSKAKLSIGESFKMIITSKYLGYIALLVLAYGVSISLIEGVWKDKVKQLYPTKETYALFMANFQAYQGFAAIFFMIIGSNILRKVSWGFAAILTPLMILITGVAFFAFVLFDNVISLYLVGIVSSGPLAIAVVIGTIQNVLSKSVKYSLFDSTKEMSYIPLDDESKTKGKAAVDVIGGRFGKSGGGIITSTFFLLLPSYDFNDATPFFASVFFFIVILWLFAVRGLEREYNKKLNEASEVR